ncbi:transposase, partial [Butyrivibrio sp. WCE2006]
MSSLDYTTLESNKRFKLNFDGGDLSSDAGLLLIKEFISKLHFDKLIDSIFHTNDSSSRRTHKDDENL